MKKVTRCMLHLGCSLMLASWLYPTPLRATENSECFECHSDETLTKESTDNILQTAITESMYVDEEKFEHSIHNINGITCVDCHTDIEELNWDEDIPHKAELQPVSCTECHEESGTEFQNSVHMKIRKKGVTMSCYACHDYHYVKPMEGVQVAERANTICLKCHNPNLSHDWLPAGDSHFAFVECVVCHAPDVPKYINLRFYDLVTNKFYDGDQILKALGLTNENFMATIDKNGNKIIDSDELEDLLFMLKQQNIHTLLRAELVADIHPIAHQINRGAAQNDCEKCHSGDSPYFNEVSILLPHNDGTVERYTIDRSVLESYHVSHFYLLGGTKIKMLDKIGILILGGGILGAFGHLFLRIVTVRLRNRRKEQ
ncbi:cytochrome c3 family protein [Desulfogranum marinum]|uniref:cytochrome c3 family protein n=1 Tax=Desulfogranum marinum TaxID=453220 RepID=UPI0029C835FA|nr:cytochrome c3 family protein [Desulfogranum marinum]